jgi:CSLREA domain-containing protein
MARVIGKIAVAICNEIVIIDNTYRDNLQCNSKRRRDMQSKSISKWSNRFTALALLATLIVSLVQVTPAYAANIMVNSNEDTDTVNVNDGKCTLREAITAANTDLPRGGCTAGSAGVDSISFAANYTITVGSQLPFITTAMTITGMGQANTIIQAAGTPNTVGWRVFQVTGTGNLILDGLTVQNGKCDASCTTVGGVEANAGGGIHNSGILTVKNSTIRGNRGTLGGGIYNSSTLTVENSTFAANEAFQILSEEDGGGAIYNSGTLTITNSVFSTNIAEKNGGAIFNSSTGTAILTNTTVSGNDGQFGGGLNNLGTVTVNNSTFSNNIGATAANFTIMLGGGGIRNSGTLTVVDSTFSGNNAGLGGGILNVCLNNCSARATISSTVFSTNSATFQGGGMYSHHRSEITVTNSTFLGNTGPSGGGGILNWLTNNATVTGSTFSGNTSLSPSSGSALGGGLYHDAGPLTVMNSTFFDNKSTLPGGGIVNRGGATLTVINSTFAGNSAGQIRNHPTAANTTTTLQNTITANSLSGGNCDGTIIDGGNNLDSGNACGFTATGSLINTNPQLDALYNNGGHTKTMALQPGSPAIDAGNDANCPATDQRGGARPQGSQCDIGAYESGAPVTFISLFSDVPDDYWALTFIDRLYEAGITGGCSTTPLNYCPDTIVTRDQMAVFLLRGIHNSSYSPPAVGGSTGFGDVPTTYWAAAWIKQLAVEGITGGCGGGNYCPTGAVTRDQMAVFLLKAKYGSSYTPPPVGGSTGFSDVPTTHWAAAWIKQLAAEGITGGCSAGVYCPGSPVTRAQMAVFLVRTFNLP